MTNKIVETTLKIRALTDVKAFGAIHRKIDQTSRKVTNLGRKMDRIGSSFTRMGAGFSLALTAPIVAATVELDNFAKRFSRIQNELKAISGASPAQVSTMESAARKAASNSIFTPTQAMQAQTDLARSGMNPNAIAGATSATLNAAAGLGVDPAFIADKMTNVILAQGKSLDTLEDASKNMAEAADRWAFATSNANVNTRQLAETLKTTTAIGVAAGIDQDLIAALAMAHGNVGFHGAAAGIAQKTALSRMFAPTPRALAVLQRRGMRHEDYISGGAPISAGGVADSLVAQGLASASEMEAILPELERIADDTSLTMSEKSAEIKEALFEALEPDPESGQLIIEAYSNYFASLGAQLDVMKFFTDLNKGGQLDLSEAKELFGLHHGAKMIPLVNSLEEISEYYEALQNGADLGQSARMADTLMEGYFGASERLKTSLENLKKTVLDAGLENALIKFKDSLRGISETFQAMPKNAQETFVKYGAIATTVGPAAMAVGLFARALAFSLAPLAWVAKGIALMTLRTIALTGALVTLNVAKMLTNPLGLAKLALLGAGAGMVALIAKSEHLDGKFGKLAGQFVELMDAFVTGDYEGVEEAWAGIVETFREIGDGIKLEVKSWVQPYIDFYYGVVNIPANIKAHFKEQWDLIVADWDALKASLQEVSDNFALWIEGPFEKVDQFVQNIVDFPAKAIAKVKESWGNIKITLDEVKQNIVDWSDAAVAAIIAPFEAVWTRVQEIYNNVRGLLGMTEDVTNPAGTSASLAQSQEINRYWVDSFNAAGASSFLAPPSQLPPLEPLDPNIIRGKIDFDAKSIGVEIAEQLVRNQASGEITINVRPAGGAQATATAVDRGGVPIQLNVGRDRTAQ